MSYSLDLDEFTTARLEREVNERKKRHAAGVCSYCLRDHGKLPFCKFPLRHSGREV
jgi:hypothetical protein